MSVENLNAMLSSSFSKSSHHMPRIEEKKHKKRKKYHTTYNKHNSDLRKKLKNMQKSMIASPSPIAYNTTEVKVVNSARICAAVAEDMNNNTRRRKHNKHFLRKSITADTVFITGSAAIANNNKRRRLNNGSAGIKKHIHKKNGKNKCHAHKNLGTNIATGAGIKIDIAYSQQFPQIGFPFIYTPDAVDNKKFQCKFVVSGDSATANVIFCDHKFGQKCHWMRHCLEKHVPLEMSQRYECKYCTMKYAQNSSLKEHVAICHSEKPPSFRCPYCSSVDITFTRWTSVLRHCRNQHSKCVEPEKPVESDDEQQESVNDEYANKYRKGRRSVNNGLRGSGKRRKSVKKCEQKHKRYDDSQILNANQIVGGNKNGVYSDGVRVGSVLCGDVSMIDMNGTGIAIQ